MTGMHKVPLGFRRAHVFDSLLMMLYDHLRGDTHMNVYFSPFVSLMKDRVCRKVQNSQRKFCVARQSRAEAAIPQGKGESKAPNGEKPEHGPGVTSMTERQDRKSLRGKQVMKGLESQRYDKFVSYLASGLQLWCALGYFSLI